MNIEEMLAVLQAFQEGKRIEYRPFGFADWTPAEPPTWNFGAGDYRVNPEPRPDVVLDYVALSGNSHAYTTSAYTKGRAPAPNLRLTYDGETGRLKSAEVLS